MFPVLSSFEICLAEQQLHKLSEQKLVHLPGPGGRKSEQNCIFYSIFFCYLSVNIEVNYGKHSFRVQPSCLDGVPAFFKGWGF